MTTPDPTRAAMQMALRQQILAQIDHCHSLAYAAGQHFLQHGKHAPSSIMTQADADAKLVRLIEEYAALRASLALPAEGAEPRKLWLWKNFVDGKPEYWAFDNPYPCVSVGGDPLTLGEPCGYALLQQSVNGRPNRSEDEVMAAMLRRAATPHPPQGRGAAGEGGERGDVVVTWDEAGRIVLVSRQDEEGRTLSVIAELGKPPAGLHGDAAQEGGK